MTEEFFGFTFYDYQSNPDSNFVLNIIVKINGENLIYISSTIRQTLYKTYSLFTLHSKKI